jgi:excisionase family DNA binding protein
MRKQAYPESAHTAANDAHVADNVASADSGLPNRLLTAFEVAEFVGCHEETVRRAYLRGLLVSQRFGVRGRRFHPADVLDWIRRGAPTRVS